MKTKLGHMQFNIRPENQAFYRDLFTLLGWQTLHEAEGIIGVGDENGVSLWFAGVATDVANDYDGPGMNHLAVAAPSQAEVDATVTFLRENNVECLFETPRHNPEFSSEESTYYQVMFTSPDNILLEVVYTGPKTA